MIMHTFFCILLVIVAISLATAMIAFFSELIEKRESGHTPYGIYEKVIKRPLDAFLSTGALLVLSPVFVISGILIRCKLGAPVFFTQDRPGREEKIFKLIKFRTMTNQRDGNGKLLPDEQRLTKFGRLLRSTSIDELPELINIIKGDMSIIGPRPLAKSYLQYYTQEERHRHDVRPGLSGLAQINGRNNLSWEDRFKYDLEYVNHLSFLLDFKIVFQTIMKVFKRENIGQGEEAPISLSVERKQQNTL